MMIGKIALLAVACGTVVACGSDMQARARTAMMRALGLGDKQAVRMTLSFS